jgi:hypothetical protein
MDRSRKKGRADGYQGKGARADENGQRGSKVELFNLMQSLDIVDV